MSRQEPTQAAGRAERRSRSQCSCGTPRYPAHRTATRAISHSLSEKPVGVEFGEGGQDWMEPPDWSRHPHHIFFAISVAYPAVYREQIIGLARAGRTGLVPTSGPRSELLCVLGVQSLPAVELHGLDAHD